MKLPDKFRVQYGEHIIEGDVSFTRSGDASYGLSVTNGYLVCGEHDAEGNHVQEDRA